jgi:PKD repeat protein
MSRNMRVFPSITAILIMLVMISARLEAADVQLAWTAPTTDVDGTSLTDLGGYRVYYGQTSGNLTQNVNVGNQTAYLLSGLIGGQVYYFVATAYDTSGNQSTFSNEVSVTTSTDPAPPPVASFTGSPTSGSAPLTSTFTDTSTGQITTWAWTFGDSSGSSAQHPQHTYAGAGTYTVTLTVNGPGGANTTSKAGYISVSTPPAPSTGLVAAYSFNDGAGSTLTDASGAGNHGTISGAQWTNAGRYGKALVFDGVNDWVTISDSSSLDLTTGMTLEAWIYPIALNGGSTNGWRSVILKQQSSQLAYALYANSDNNRPSGYVYTSSDLGVFGNAQLPLNTWKHLATTYDGSVQRLYVNGSQVGSRSIGGSIKTSGGPLRLGGNSIWGEYFNGRIDEVRVYNKALTASQIQTDMNAPVSPIGSAALVRLAPLANRLHTALRGRSGAGRGPAVGLSQVDRPASQSLRQRDGTTSSAAQPYLIEAGDVQVTPQWQRVEFAEAFVDPIVIANTLSSKGGAPALIGIRSVEATGFEIRLQQMTDESGTGLSAVAGFLVLERGTYTLADGTLMEAGRVATAPSETALTVPFSRRFNQIPVVMTSVISANEVAPVTSHIQSVLKNDLHVELHGSGSAAHAGDIATFAYIALEPSAGTLQGITFEAQRARDIATGQWHALAFLDAFDAPPVLLAEIQGGSSGRSLPLRWDAKRADGVEVTIDTGPQDNDAPDTPAKVGYIALY